MARREPQRPGVPAFATWLEQHPAVCVATFASAAEHGEILLLAISGQVTADVLRMAGAEHLKGKIVIDVSNALDFSGGFPPTLAVCNTDSVGEQLQPAFPAARVVKTLNTVNAVVMTDPGQLADGDHHLFVSDDDADAKARVMQLLLEWFGWRHVIDLGDMTTAGGTEMYLPLWLRLMAVNGPAFNIKVVRE